MIYTQYQESALKHLHATKTALHGIQFFHGNSVLTQQKRESLLLDVYYLSGYTLESIINYSIYKRIGWTTDVYNMRNSHYRIAYKKPFTDRASGRYFPILDSITGRDFVPNYWIEQHKFYRNIQLLHTLLPGNTVPLINPSIIVPNPLKKMVFDSVAGRQNYDYWKPDLRYQPATWFASRFSETDLRKFVELTEKVYNELLRIT